MIAILSAPGLTFVMQRLRLLDLLSTLFVIFNQGSRPCCVNCGRPLPILDLDSLLDSFDDALIQNPLQKLKVWRNVTE